MTSGFHPAPPARTGAPAADLADLLESYVFCARAEGKSPKTIDIRITSVLALLDFLRAAALPTPVHDIGPHELRRFIVHLQGVRAYQSHPFNPPRPQGLSGHTVNGYLRSLRAFWSWLVAAILSYRRSHAIGTPVSMARKRLERFIWSA